MVVVDVVVDGRSDEAADTCQASSFRPGTPPRHGPGGVGYQPVVHRVTVLDPDRMTREALARVLSRSDRIRVVHESDRLDDVRRVPGEGAPPDVAVATRSFPDADLLRLARDLRRRRGPPALVVTDLPPVDSLILRFAEAGAAGFVRRGQSAEEMVAVVEAVARDETRVSGRLARAALDRLAELAELCRDTGLEPTLLLHLTPRESEVLSLVSEGMTNREIARRLSVSPGTVKSHVHRILEKLRVSNRDQAARYFRLCSPDAGRATAR